MAIGWTTSGSAANRVAVNPSGSVICFAASAAGRGAGPVLSVGWWPDSAGFVAGAPSGAVRASRVRAIRDRVAITTDATALRVILGLRGWCRTGERASVQAGEDTGGRGGCHA